jgi:hypothetical protein
MIMSDFSYIIIATDSEADLTPPSSQEHQAEFVSRKRIACNVDLNIIPVGKSARCKVNDFSTALSNNGELLFFPNAYLYLKKD